MCAVEVISFMVVQLLKGSQKDIGKWVDSTTPTAAID